MTREQIIERAKIMYRNKTGVEPTWFMAEATADFAIEVVKEKEREAFDAAKTLVKHETSIGEHHYIEYKYPTFEDYLNRKT